MVVEVPEVFQHQVDANPDLSDAEPPETKLKELVVSQ